MDEEFMALQEQVFEMLKAGLISSRDADWLLAAPSAKADRSACKAWCGLTAREVVSHAKARAGAFWYAGDNTSASAPRWCSPACRDAKYPPLGATTEAKRVPVDIKTTINRKCPLCGTEVPSNHIHVCGGSRRKSAASDSGTGAKWAPPVFRLAIDGRIRDFATEDARHAFSVSYSAWMAAQSGQSAAKLPARIDRRLTFQAWDDDFAPEAGR
jgi:hypothetical protein